MHSNVQCPISNGQCPMSNVQCPMSNVQCPMSSVQCPISNIQMSNVQWPMSNVQCPMSNVQCPMSNVQCPCCMAMMSGTNAQKTSSTQPVIDPTLPARENWDDRMASHFRVGGEREWKSRRRGSHLSFFYSRENSPLVSVGLLPRLYRSTGRLVRRHFLFFPTNGRIIHGFINR